MTGKPTFDHLALLTDALGAVDAVLRDGGAKHGKRGFEAGAPRALYPNKTIRHALAHLRGDAVDESGHCNLACAAADALIALALHLRGLEMEAIVAARLPEDVAADQLRGLAVRSFREV